MDSQSPLHDRHHPLTSYSNLYNCIQRQSSITLGGSISEAMNYGVSTGDYLLATRHGRSVVTGLWTRLSRSAGSVAQAGHRRA